MDKRILIIYSFEEEITYSFWKYFFQSCGVWVKACKIGNNIQLEEKKYQTVYILSNDDIKKMTAISSNAVYIVKSNSSYTSFRKLNNICTFQWRKRESYYEVIDKIFGMSSVFRELLNIYIDSSLWLNAWLYHEMPYDENDIWNEQIRKECDKALTQLQILKRKYVHKWKMRYFVEYMEIYCRFLMAGANRRNEIGVRASNIDLLSEIFSFAIAYEWTLSLLILAAQVSDLNPLTRGHVIKYLQRACEMEKNAGILYDVGRLYEEVYGELDTAYMYYEDSIMQDHFYYKAIYKLALRMEKQQEWFQAMKYYRNIIEILPRLTEGNYSSTSEIEYTYKANARLADIYREQLRNNEIARLYEDNIRYLQIYMKEKGFSKLEHCISMASNVQNTMEIFRKVIDTLEVRMK